MNILLINHYAGSPKLGMAYRPYYLAQEWINAGHDVTILCADNSHLRRINPVIKHNFDIIPENDVKYCWIKTPPYQGNGVARIRNMFSFFIKLRFNIGRVSKLIKPDVVIASSTYPLDNYIAARIAKKNSAKHIFEVHDLWPLSPMELGGFSKCHPFIVVMQAAENFAYKRSYKVISMLPKTLEYMIQHGLKESKWNYVPNGVVTEEWNKPSEIPESQKNLIKKLKDENKILIGYAGGHALSNSLQTICKTAEKLKNDKRFSFVLVGKGQEKQNLIDSYANLNNIHFLDPVPKLSVPTLLSYFDYLFIGWNRSSLYRFGISPNKVFDYMMAEKPIIHAVEAGNDIVKDANAGISVEPENPDEVVKAILKLTSMSEEELIKLGKNGKDYVLKYHDYKILAEKFLTIIQS